MLADAGTPLGCQIFLVRGVNDPPEVMVRLVQRSLMARVMLYYIYMTDQVTGAEHFRTSVETGLRIMKALRGWTSRLATAFRDRCAGRRRQDSADSQLYRGLWGGRDCPSKFSG